ncbi:MAG: acetate--CoA ligase family protein [Nitrososphaerota archaeon]|nr:acetate--CoA ligase family protein [Nitrososphaerota archaeon]
MQLTRERLTGMKSFFEPKSIAVAGVSTDPNKMGSIIFANLLANRGKGLLKAKVYALNPAHDHIGEEPCYPSVDALPETPELLVVAVPESITPGLMQAAAKRGAKAAVMVTSGYAEAGRGDVEKRIGKLAARHGMRILGPNTIGLVDTRSGVDSLFLRPTKRLPDGTEIVSLLRPLEGGIVIITQSGHLGETISEELAASGVGIRALVGTGNQLDVSVEDVMQYFADDSNTKVMAVYLEGVRDGRRFIQVARYASSRKPVVVFKVGKTDVGARAALTHTASLVGDYDVYRAAFRQAGLVEAGSLQELIDCSVALSMIPAPKGNRVAVITNAGGVGAIAADEAQSHGMQVDPLGEGAKNRLRSELEGAPSLSNASLANPIDLTASATTDEFVRATRTVLSFPEYDLVVLMPTHQAPAIDHDVGRRLAAVVSESGKPVAACVIGASPLAGKIHGEFMSKGIPSFPTPERAVRALAAATLYSSFRELPAGAPVVRRRSRGIGGRGGPVPRGEVGRLLRSHGIGEPKSVTVRSAKDLGSLKTLRFPVACKLLAEGVLHKTEVGGVALNVAGIEEAKSEFDKFVKAAKGKRLRFQGMLAQEMVRKGVEVILGGTRDTTFGPVVVLGLGGTYTEVTRNYALRVAPVSPEEAKSMLVETKLASVLAGYRGGPRADLERLAAAVSGFSKIMPENPRIEQMEVNPLMVTEDEVLAVDARAILGSSG